MTSLARATAIMSFGTVLSRFTGVLRLTAIAAAIGAVETKLGDTYQLANTAPNIIYELFLGGVLTSVFVPVFVDLIEKEGRERAWEIASAVINVSIIVVAAITALGMLGAPLIAKFYAIRLPDTQAAEQQEVLTFLLRLLLPQIMFYGLMATVAGLLNAHRRFGPPMYTPILNNLTVIATFLLFAKLYGQVTLEELSTRQMLLIGLGTTAGVAANALAQLPFLRGLGRYRPTLSLDHPSIRKLLRLSMFVVGYVVVNQVGYLIVQWLANGKQGAYAAYVYAFTFFMLPHGLFAVSVITALLPAMSAAAANNRWDEYRQRLSIGVRATVLLILPAAVGYLVLAEPIVQLLLQYGVFGARSTEAVAGALRFFVLGLVPFSLFQLLLRSFYAIHDTKTPFLVNAAAVAVNIAVNVVLFVILDLGVRGLAAGHALSYLFGVTLLWAALSRRTGGTEGRRITASAARIGAAAAGMGVVVWLVSSGVAADGAADISARIWALVIPVVAGAAAYLALAYALRVQELSFVTGLVRRRTGETRS